MTVKANASGNVAHMRVRSYTRLQSLTVAWVQTKQMLALPC